LSITLEGEALAKAYGGMEAVKDCSFSIGPGITALMGHNGSGKSTLLRLFALLEEPTSGKLIYKEGGSELAKDIRLRRRLTLVLPGAIIFNATVLYNAAYGLKVRGMSNREQRELAMNALWTVGLADMADKQALTLSSGEAQRLAIARALAVRPDVLFMDEPTASVDEENTAAIEALIKGIAGGHRVPVIVLATHDREQAGRLADMVITMSRGRIEQN
jgi:tungstate transport system ATP-binding protein